MLFTLYEHHTVNDINLVCAAYKHFPYVSSTKQWEREEKQGTKPLRDKVRSHQHIAE